MNHNERLDWLLRFRPDIDRRHEEATRDERIAHMQGSIVVGLILYNFYGICCYFLLPDVAVTAIILRSLVLSPLWILFRQILPYLPAAWREFLVLPGMLAVMALSAGMFLLSQSPLAPYFLVEPILAMVCANMLLVVRYRWCLALTAAAAVSLIGMVALKHGLDHGRPHGMDDGLAISLIVQGLTGYIFTGYANWYAERRSCRGFLKALDIEERADAAEQVGRIFRGLSLTDALTGLPNRRHLEEEFDRRAEAGGPITLMMIDVDHFKPYNDRLGHAAGDECLRRIGRCLDDFAKLHDGFAARFGGEEFTLVLSGQIGPAVGEAATAAVSDMALAHPGRPDGIASVTISVGLARTDGFAGEPADLGQMIARADRALYEAKRAGRNRARAAA